MSVLGYDPQNSGREFRDRIGIVLQTSGIEAELTVDLIGLVDSADCDRGDDGVVAYDLDVAVSNLPAATVSLLVGVACFATLGLALAALAGRSAHVGAKGVCAVSGP